MAMPSTMVAINCENPIDGHASSCYAANLGDSIDCLVWWWAPGSLAEGDSETFNWHPEIVKTIHGVIYVRSEITMARISDGTSITYLLGEKPVDPDYYMTGGDAGDDWTMYSGHQDDIIRSVGAPGTAYFPLPPMQDTPGVNCYAGFGMPMPRAATWRCAMARCIPSAT